MTGWEWDRSLFAGTAAHYLVGRMPYPRELADALRDALGLDGTGRLLDVGCGPGSLTLLLAPLFAASVGVDPDPDMLREAARIAGPARVWWRELCAEDLPADLGTLRVVVFAQFQVNPTNVGRRSQSVRLEASGVPTLSVDRTVTVFP